MIKDKNRITYKSQATGEYEIFVDGKYWGKSDNYYDLMEDIEYIEYQFKKEQNIEGAK